MNIVSIIKTTILSILFLESSSLAEIHCDYSFPSIKLCSSESCPVDYHMCNSFDRQLLIDSISNNRFNNVSDTYYTSIASDGENCHSSPDENAISISNIDDDLYKNSCNYNNKIIRYGEGILVNKCIFCTCSEHSSKCINTCKYSKYLTETLTYKETEHNVLDTKSGADVTCRDVKHINKLACCKNNNCKMPHCLSCMSYGRNEVCNICEKNHYFNKHYRSRCYNINEMDLICDGFYEINQEQQEFKCMKCVHGSIEEMGSTKQCVCEKGYYGAECNQSYNKIKCMDNGVYNTMTRKCDCYDGYSGYNCQYNSIHACIHGTYNSRLESCICQKGYFGDDCSEKVECVYGTVVENVCICNDRFSGEDCSIPRPETTVQKQDKQKQLGEYFKRPCKYGLYNNETNICDCINGYQGSDCSVSKCVNGVYNSLLNICECIEHYYGAQCENSCLKDCNYNGNMCNYKKECRCLNGWYGTTCDRIQVDDDPIIIGNTLEVNFKKRTTTDVVQNTTIDIEMIHCYTDNCIPFKVTPQFKTDESNRNTPTYDSPRLRRQLASYNQENDFVITIPECYVNKTVEAVYIYPNNNYSLSYYGGTSDIIIQNATHNSYYFMIEPIRVNDTQLHNESIIYEFDSLDNTTRVENSNETVYSNETVDSNITIYSNNTVYETDDYNTDDLINTGESLQTSTPTPSPMPSSIPSSIPSSSPRHVNNSTIDIENQDTQSQISNSGNETSSINISTNTYLVVGVCFGFASVVFITIFVLRKKKDHTSLEQRIRKNKTENTKTKPVIYTMNNIYFNQNSLHNVNRV